VLLWADHAKANSRYALCFVACELDPRVDLLGMTMECPVKLDVVLTKMSAQRLSWVAFSEKDVDGPDKPHWGELNLRCCAAPKTESGKIQDRIDRFDAQKPGLQQLSRAHRNRLLPISSHFSAEVGQTRLRCAA